MSIGITEEDVISILLDKIFLLKVIQAVIFSIDTYEQDIISVGNENKKISSNTNGIIVIIFLCYHCWGQIIVYPYFIWINVLFGWMKQKNVLTSLKLDIWLIQILILTKHSEKKCINVWKLHLVQSHNLILEPHSQK